MEREFSHEPPKMTWPVEELHSGIIDSLLATCRQVADVLAGVSLDIPIEDLLAPDLIAFLASGPLEQQAVELSHIMGAGGRQGHSWIPRVVRRTETGQLVVVEARPSEGVSFRGAELWWLTRKAREGVCPVCSAPLDSDPMKATCTFCGEGLAEQPWIVVRVVDGVSGVGEGKANPSVQPLGTIDVGTEQVKARIARAARAYVDAMMSGDFGAISQYAEPDVLEPLQRMASFSNARATIERWGGISRIAIETELSSRADHLLSDLQLMSVTTGPRQERCYAPFLRQSWRWERHVAAACPRCGGELPKADAPDACPYCGNVEGVGEWRIHAAEFTDCDLQVKLRMAEVREKAQADRAAAAAPADEDAQSEELPETPGPETPGAATQPLF